VKEMMKTIAMLIVALMLAGCQTGKSSAATNSHAKPNLTIIAMHPVQKGETLSSICRKHYGRSDHETLALVTRANPEILMESTGSAQPHMTLRIPELPDKEK
jgi:uncharacterized lipoprotein YajG